VIFGRGGGRPRSLSEVTPSELINRGGFVCAHERSRGRAAGPSNQVDRQVRKGLTQARVVPQAAQLFGPALYNLVGPLTRIRFALDDKRTPVLSAETILP
jgi:hypothetical protein